MECFEVGELKFIGLFAYASFQIQTSQIYAHIASKSKFKLTHKPKLVSRVACHVADY